MTNDRDHRLKCEQDLLMQLAARSEVLELETTNEPADQYILKFNAQLIERVDTSNDEVIWTDEHRIELELSWSFPKSAPDVRWLTRFFHPNVSSSGFVSLSDIGLAWDSQMTLDVVCERLWDVSRHAWYDLDRAANYPARRWIAGNPPTALPVDQRSIVAQPSAKPENIISYRQKRGGQPATHSETQHKQSQQLENPDPNQQPKPGSLEGLEIIGDSNAGKESRKADINDVIFVNDEDIITDVEIVESDDQAKPKRQPPNDDIFVID